MTIGSRLSKLDLTIEGGSMKTLMILMTISLLAVSCSSSRSKSIKSIKFKNKVGKSVGTKTFKQCHWKFSVMNVGMYDGLVVDEMITKKNSNYVAAKNVSITQSGMGMSGLGRYCVEAKGDFYATSK